MAELARKAGLDFSNDCLKMEKGLPTRKNSEPKVAKALKRPYEEIFLEKASKSNNLALSFGQSRGRNILNEDSTEDLLLLS